MKQELSTRNDLPGSFSHPASSYRGWAEPATPGRRKKKNLWQLYALFPLMAGLLWLAIVFVPSLELRRVLEIAIVLVIYGLMALWQQRNHDKTTP